MLVRIANKLPQLVVVSVLNEAGDSVELRLGPNAVSDPIEESDLTEHARLLVSNGHLKLRTVAG